MRKLLLSLLLILNVSCVSVNAPPKEKDPIVEHAFKYACDQLANLGYWCGPLEPPIAVWSTITHLTNAYGIFIPGERYIFVSPTGKHPQQTLVHEIVHYILFYNGERDRCRSEEIARFVAGQTYDWRKQYGCLKD